jgi:prophage tail gpP-like protein
MTLKRSKDKLTGELSVTIFGGDLPSAPMARQANVGAEIQVYIAGQLAFTGTVDKRTGDGKRGKDAHQDAKAPKHAGASPGKHSKGSEGGKTDVSIGPNEYTIKLTARGKTKRLIDSSHQHPTTNMLKPTTKQVVEKLVEPWKTQVEWKGEVIKLDKVRFRDGARVIDELFRVATENCYFMYETREGKLRVTDGVGQDSGGGGDPLILGQNILTFSAEQSEDKAKSKIKVKGQRSPKNKWGEEAVLKTFKTIKTKFPKDFVPETVQHYGDGDEKTLERRARFEANKRNSESKKITIEVFHVQTPSGRPWDIGDTHYVEVPCEGIFDMFECTELEYHVEHAKTLKTKLTLSPPPSGGEGGAGGGFGLANLAGMMSMGAARQSQSGISISSGLFPDPWTAPILSEMPLMTLVEEAAKLATTPAPPEPIKQQPPLQLPEWFGEKV